MKGKHLVLLLLLVALVGWAAFSLFNENRASWSESGGGSGKKVLEFPINDVARITIKSTGGELNLAKKGDEWAVQERADYAANFEQVSDLVRKLWDVKTVQNVKVGPSQFSRLDLIEPGKEGSAGTLVELKDKDSKTLAALILGKKQMRKSEGLPGEMGGFPSGRYVMPVGAATSVSLVSDSFEEIDGKPERWLKRDFFKIENPKSIVLAGLTEPQRWTLARESATAEWKLGDAKPEETLDTAKISSFATAFTSASFADVLAPDAKPEETGLDKPTSLTIETTDNFKYEFKIGKLNGDNYPVAMTVSADLAKERTPGKDEKPEDKTKLDEEFKATLKRLEDKLSAEKRFEARPYLIAKYAIDPFLKDRAALLAEKKPETPPPTPPATSQATPPKPGPVTVTTPPVSAPPLPPNPPTPAPEKPPTPAPDKPAAPPAPADPSPEKPAAPPADPPVPEAAKPAPPETPEPKGEKPPAPPAQAPDPRLPLNESVEKPAPANGN